MQVYSKVLGSETDLSWEQVVLSCPEVLLENIVS